ncbi:hypothetical protein GCM10011425_23840 [Mucilaginibacter galii]|uniref:Beta-carotene 15,15'-monooxygenase n=1 Tax=Mucilaginibacter galii TaxID=2005073 RepID=A0A917N3N1_9SPHI|nr:hypothetical protein [Mucilaginibacter galii]GGI51172.1 hypothetical protein GCM10011425_23840 [Mucilaginibacter galii]
MALQTHPQSNHKRNAFIIALFAILLFVGGSYMLHRISVPKRNSVANGLLADMLITFPVAYYYLIIKPFKYSIWKLLLVFTCCSAVAYMVLPLQQQHYVLQLRKVSVLVELAVIAYAISKFNKIRQEYQRLQTELPDGAYHMQQSIIAVLGNTFTIRMLACELTVLRFGLFWWMKSTFVSLGAKRFTTHRESGYMALFGVLLFVMLVELFAVHLLLMQYSAKAAIIVSALSAYGMLFLLADMVAISKNPVLILEKQLLLRTGMRWRAHTCLGNIETITKLSYDYEPEENCFKGAIIKSSANLYLRFKQPVTVSRLYRSPIIVNSIVLSIDEPDAFTAALQVG